MSKSLHTAVAAMILVSGAFGADKSPPPAAAVRWADQLLSRMSLEAKAGQIVFVDMTGSYAPDTDPGLRRTLSLVRDFGVGGIVLYGGTPRDVAALTNRLQNAAKVPLLVAADFEGGPGQQVTGATEFPANMAFAAIGSEDLVYRAARVGALEGRAMGIALTYSPVVDIQTQPENPAESVRSFGADIALLGKLVRSYIAGYRDHGMLTTAKHFPGRGDTSPLPEAPLFQRIDKPAAAVESGEMAAFRMAIAAGVPFVMSEHIAVPSLAGGSVLPASVERRLATGWLRGKLGFDGLLTTDDLWYDHVVERFGAVGVGVKALQAGHDLLLKPKDAAAMIQAVVKAVRDGQVSEGHIDQAVRKLLVWKARLNLHKNRLVDESKVTSVVGVREHLELAQQVADKSLTVLKNDGVLPFSAAPSKIVNITVQKLDVDPSPGILADRMKAAFPGLRSFTIQPSTGPAMHEAALSAARTADLVTISLFVQRDKFGDAAPLREADLWLIEQVVAARPRKVLAMSFGNPYLIRKLDGVPAFAVGYGERGWFGNQTIYVESLIRLIKGQIAPGGKLPVNVSPRFRIGDGITW
ncbi:MAG: hypothetical protein OZ929_21445 [Bryobacterales bacterium]|nr:hypothetical protein [Bryobacterales bacterium]